MFWRCLVSMLVMLINFGFQHCLHSACLLTFNWSKNMCVVYLTICHVTGFLCLFFCQVSKKTCYLNRLCYYEIYVMPLTFLNTYLHRFLWSLIPSIIGVIKNIQSNQTEGEQTGAKKQLISPSPLLGKYLLYNEWLKNATLTLLFVFQTLEKLRYPRLQRVLLRIVLMDHGWWFQRLLTRTSSLMLAYEV